MRTPVKVPTAAARNEKWFQASDADPRGYIAGVLPTWVDDKVSDDTPHDMVLDIPSLYRPSFLI